MTLRPPKGSRPYEYPYEPTSVTEWEKIYDPKLIEQFILARNKAHFSQAQGTPFTIPPLNKIGHAANTKEAEKSYKGKYQNHCRMPTNRPYKYFQK